LRRGGLRGLPSEILRAGQVLAWGGGIVEDRDAVHRHRARGDEVDVTALPRMLSSPVLVVAAAAIVYLARCRSDRCRCRRPSCRCPRTRHSVASHNVRPARRYGALTGRAHERPRRRDPPQLDTPDSWGLASAALSPIQARRLASAGDTLRTGTCASATRVAEPYRRRSCFTRIGGVERSGAMGPESDRRSRRWSREFAG
jgi:hypothetical protein